MATRTRSRYRYVSDDGNNYSVSLADDIGGETGLGFVAADGTEAPLPGGFEMRYVMLMDPATGRSFKRPVGTVAAAAWATPLTGSYALDDWNATTDVATVVTSCHGEKRHYGSRPVPGP